MPSTASQRPVACRLDALDESGESSVTLYVDAVLAKIV